MNIAKMRKLKKWILAEPRRYNQRVWLDQEDSEYVKEQKPPCGTVACLAGNACLMEGFKPHVSNSFMVVKGAKEAGDVEYVATNILGLSMNEATILFNGLAVGWVDEAQQAYQEAKTPLQRAKAAAMQIDAMIKQGSK